MAESLSDKEVDESTEKIDGMDESTERIDGLEKNLEELRTNVDSSSLEMKRAVEDLRKAVVDIRSAVSEIENPFNLLRVITDEKDLNRMKETRPVIEKGQGVEKVGEVYEGSVEAGEKVKEPPTSLEEVAGLLSFTQGASLVRWIYMMLDLGFEGENIRGVCKYCEYLGLIPRGSSPYVSNMVDAVIKAKSNGIFEEQVILSMYTAAESAGTKINSGDIVESIIQLLRRSKSEKMVK